MCSLASDCMQQGIGTQYSTNLMIINGLTIALYIGTWLLLKYRSSSNISAANQSGLKKIQINTINRCHFLHAADF